VRFWPRSCAAPERIIWNTLPMPAAPPARGRRTIHTCGPSSTTRRGLDLAARRSYGSAWSCPDPLAPSSEPPRSAATSRSISLTLCRPLPLLADAPAVQGPRSCSPPVAEERRGRDHSCRRPQTASHHPRSPASIRIDIAEATPSPSWLKILNPSGGAGGRLAGPGAGEIGSLRHCG